MERESGVEKIGGSNHVSQTSSVVELMGRGKYLVYYCDSTHCLKHTVGSDFAPTTVVHVGRLLVPIIVW